MQTRSHVAGTELIHLRDSSAESSRQASSYTRGLCEKHERGLQEAESEKSELERTSSAASTKKERRGIRVINVARDCVRTD